MFRHHRLAACWLFVLATGGRPAVAQAPNEKEVVPLLTGHTGPVHNVRFTTEGRLVSASGWPEGDRTVRVWDVANRVELKRIDVGDGVHSLDLSTDNRYALVGLGSGRVKHLDLETGATIGEFALHSKAVGWIAFAPDGKHGLSCSDDGSASMWKLDDGREVFQAQVESRQARAGVLLPGGTRLMTGDGRGNLQIWDLAQGKEVKRFRTLYPVLIDALALTSDGLQVIVSGIDGTRIYDIDAGVAIRNFQEEVEEHHSAALSPDGRWLVTTGFDGRVRLWDYNRGALVRVLAKMDEFGFTVAFSPDSRWAASGGGGVKKGDQYLPGNDHQIRLWAMPSPEAVAADTPAAKRKWWLTVVGIAMLVLVVAGFGLWFILRKRRTASTR